MQHLPFSGMYMMNYVGITYRRIWTSSGKMAESVFKIECSSNFQVPTQTGGYTDPQEIANCFKQTFSACCFASYTDTQSVTELFTKMSDADDDTNLLNNALNVLDVKKALEKLQDR